MTAEPARGPLAAAAARRTLDAKQRVRSALHELAREGVTVTFAGVAERARVSRAFLYQHPELRSEIEALRGGQASAQPSTRQRASDASLRARLRATLDEAQRQREEIARLREELALAHGRVRELELEHRVRRA